MKASGVAPDAFVYPIIIKSAAAPVIFHSHLLKLGLLALSEPHIRNALLASYAAHGPIRAAADLFDEMSDRAPADWNALLSGYWKWGLEAQACTLFARMPAPNVISWTAMVTGYSKLKDLAAARRYFDQMPQRNVVSWNAMLTGYSHNGMAREAVHLFSKMLNSGCQPDDTTWVTIISQLFDDMGEHRNSVTWNTMIAAYTRIGDLLSATELFNEVPERTVVTWNSMVAGYAQNGQSTMAVILFKEMIASNGVKPDEVTMVSVFSACGHLGALELGNWAVKYLEVAKIKLSISGYNSLISMYSKCGSIEAAISTFQSMDVKDVVSYNTLIAGLAAHGQGGQAVELWKEMNRAGVEPDRLTYLSLLTACSHAGLLEQGQTIFSSINAPSVDHYACMVDLLGRMGKLEEAKNLIATMPMEPHAGVYGSLLNASRMHRKVEMGQFAADKLFQIEPNHSGNYVLLSNVYASAGKWRDAERIREAMWTDGVKKTTGWSSVEFGGKIHKFVVGDRTHEKSEDIHKVLREIQKKLRGLGYEEDKSCVLRDVEEEEKEEMVGAHSEKLAVAFALLVSSAGSVIRVMKNLRVCQDCHAAIKIISKIEGREIIVRDNNRFHCFKDGVCSCSDYW
uniref:DYW domain-containing protein n=1 Tax=Kalanchoe fedtschenkoi TaxID=63787 RepID=A0A7N0RFN7_KALFE